MFIYLFLNGQVIEEVDGLYENEGASVPEGEALCAAIASLESQQAEAGSERRGPLAHLLSLLYEKQVSTPQHTTPSVLYPFSVFLAPLVCVVCVVCRVVRCRPCCVWAMRPGRVPWTVPASNASSDTTSVTSPTPPTPMPTPQACRCCYRLSRNWGRGGKA